MVKSMISQWRICKWAKEKYYSAEHQNVTSKSMTNCYLKLNAILNCGMNPMNILDGCFMMA